MKWSWGFWRNIYDYDLKDWVFQTVLVLISWLSAKIGNYIYDIVTACRACDNTSLRQCQYGDRSTGWRRWTYCIPWWKSSGRQQWSAKWAQSLWTILIGGRYYQRKGCFQIGGHVNKLYFWTDYTRIPGNPPIFIHMWAQRICAEISKNGHSIATWRVLLGTGWRHWSSAGAIITNSLKNTRARNFHLAEIWPLVTDIQYPRLYGRTFAHADTSVVLTSVKLRMWIPARCGITGSQDSIPESYHFFLARY